MDEGRCIDRVRIDPDQLPLNTLWAHHVVNDEWILGDYSARVIRVPTPEDIGGIRIVHRCGKRSPEQHKVLPDERADESLVRCRVKLLLFGVPPASQDDQYVRQVSAGWRLVGAGLAADANPNKSFRSSNHLTLRIWRQEDVVARTEVVLRALDAYLAALADHDGHLFLFIPSMVVFGPFGVGRQLELVDPERSHTEGFPKRAEDAQRIDIAPLRDVVSRDVIRADDLMSHRAPPRQNPWLVDRDPRPWRESYERRSGSRAMVTRFAHCQVPPILSIGLVDLLRVILAIRCPLPRSPSEARLFPRSGKESKRRRKLQLA
jgi:hypothetical protein